MHACMHEGVKKTKSGVGGLLRCCVSSYTPLVITTHPRHCIPRQGKGWFGGGADLTPYYLHDQDVTVRARES